MSMAKQVLHTLSYTDLILSSFPVISSCNYDCFIDTGRILSNGRTSSNSWCRGKLRS